MTPAAASIFTMSPGMNTYMPSMNSRPSAGQPKLNTDSQMSAGTYKSNPPSATAHNEPECVKPIWLRNPVTPAAMRKPMIYPPVTPVMEAFHASSGVRSAQGSELANIGSPSAPSAMYPSTAPIPHLQPITPPVKSTPKVCSVMGVGFSGR